VSVYYDEFFGSPKKIFANGRGFDFLDGQTDRRTDGQTDRNFVEILGKLCFARLKLNLKTEDRFKLKTKLGLRYHHLFNHFIFHVQDMLFVQTD
jgi:hypothetical protein